MHEGNDYERQDQHEHTYNSTHHRVVTYACNHKSISPDSDDLIPDCDRILDIYYFYESGEYQIIKLEKHSHMPSKAPLDMQEKFTQMPGITRLTTSKSS